MKTAGCFLLILYPSNVLVLFISLSSFQERIKDLLIISFENRDNLILSFLISPFVLEHYTE